MDLLIFDAAPPSPAALTQLASQELPALQSLLRSLSPTPVQQDKPESLSPLSELLHARALGLPQADGLLPWAALQARQQGLSAEDPAKQGWALITPCHWKVHTDHVHMEDPRQIQISAEENAALLAAARPYFLEDGMTLHALPDGQWLACGAVFRGLPSASVERVRNGRVDAWLPRQAEARALRRLQNEMQMLLYTHPVNDARAARNLSAINSFWVSGTGDLPTGWQAPSQPVKTLRLMDRGDASDPQNAWLIGWKEADATLLQALVQAADQAALNGTGPGPNAGPSVSLTLCGPRGALRLEPAPRNAWQRLRARFSTPDIASLMNPL